MKRKVLFLSLALMILTATIFCCCFTKDAFASKTEVPSCHQTSQEESSDTSSECECDTTLGVLQNTSYDQVSLASSTWIYPITSFVNNFKTVDFIVIANNSSPFFDTSPIYIKHSVLRI